MERLHIIDGYGYVFRAHFGIANARNQSFALVNAEGMPTGALHVYASMLARLHRELQPERVVVVFDAPGKSFRSELDPNYKMNRRETPEDLKRQMPHFRPLTEAFCWPVISVPEVEADDAIATITRMARKRDWDVCIYSGDKDLMQLVEERVTVIDSMRRVTYDSKRVHEKFGVRPDQLGDWLSLVGDASDNVPGMVGVGAKGATKLLTTYGDLSGILSRVDELKGKQRERFGDPEKVAQLKRSKLLVTLKTDVEIPDGIDSFVPRDWNGTALQELCEKFGFPRLGERHCMFVERSNLSESSSGEEAARESRLVRVELTSAEVVLSESRIADEVRAAKGAGHFAIHVEFDRLESDREVVVGIGLMVSGRAPVYIPISHRYLGAPAEISAQSVALLADVVSDREVEVICHDSKTLYRILSRVSMALGGVSMDLMLASYLLEPGTDVRDVWVAIERSLGVRIQSRFHYTGKGKKEMRWETVDVADAAGYVGPILCSLLAAKTPMTSRLLDAKLHALYCDIELPLAKVLSEMEEQGILLDVAVLGEIRDKLRTRITAIEHQVFAITGGPLNLSSPKQLAVLLFETLGLRSTVMKQTKVGFSTDSDVLEAMVDVHEIVAPIMEHRELSKLMGTYVDALPRLVYPSTQRLHTTFRQDVAATGRLSSQDPNLQNIPIRTDAGRSIRRAFVASEGKQLLSADYSQIELRIMAHLSKDPVLTRAFMEGVDVHSQTAAEVFGIEVEEVGPGERRVAKAVNYGLIYGQSEFGLARALGITREEAGAHMNRYFERFAGVRDYMDVMVRSARQSEAAYTLCGRRRPILGLASHDLRVRSASERIAQNTPIQGSAADIMKLAILAVYTDLRDFESEVSMLLTVHDELLIEVKSEWMSEVSVRVQGVMENAYKLSVPLVVDLGTGSNWADAH